MKKKKWKIEVELVLWNRLCGRGKKVSRYASIEEAIAYLKEVEPDAEKLETFIVNGELRYCENDVALATISVRIK